MGHGYNTQFLLYPRLWWNYFCCFILYYYYCYHIIVLYYIFFTFCCFLISIHSWNKRTPYGNSTFGFDLSFLSSLACDSAPTYQILSELDDHHRVTTLCRLFNMTALPSQIYFRFPVLWPLIFRKAKNYLHTKFRQDISIHGWDITTSVCWKQTSALWKLYSRFRFWHLRHHRYVILHRPTKFYTNWKINDKVMTSYRFSKMAAILSQTYFIKANSPHSPYWSSTPGFHIDIFTAVGMWFCIILPNFGQIRRSPTELWRRVDFYKIAAIASQIYFRFLDWLRLTVQLKRSKAIGVPNFDQISQSTAAISPLPVSENKRPPYWNSTSCFDFDIFPVIGIPTTDTLYRLASRLMTTTERC